jgi:hypothetical protein
MALMTQVGLEFIARDRSRNTIYQFNRGLTDMSRTLLRIAGVGGGIYALQRGFRSTIAEASSAQETFAKFDVVFRDQSRDVKKWAEDFGDSVGRATHDVAGWAAGLQDTFVPLGIARDKAAELSKSLVSLAVDVASFNNKADADVIRDFTSALVGNHETVRKYGIIISENAIKQEALRQGLNKTYSELTDLEKVQLRYALIQKGTTDAQGDAIRTADSYANQVKRLSANWKEFMVDAGTPAISVLADLTKGMNAGYEATRKWSKETKDTFEALGQVYDEYIKQQERTKNMARPGPGAFGGFGAGSMGAPPRRPVADAEMLPMGRLIIPPKRQQYLEEMRQRAKLIEDFMNYQGPLPGTEYKVEVEKRANDEILSDTRDFLDSVRHMHDKTRTEKLLILDNYVKEHAQYMQQLPRAEEMVAKERLAIERSRIDQMLVYQTELREDMENISTYISDKFAEAARSIEDSMSGAFQSMISKGASFKDAMVRFLDDVSRAFSKMAADMAARMIMHNIGMPMFERLGSLLGFHEGWIPVHHQGWVPAAINTYHDGRKIRPNERFALIENDEYVVPSSKVVRGAGSAAPSVIIYNESGQAIEQKSEPEFDGERWVVSLIARNYIQGGSLQKLIR